MTVNNELTGLCSSEARYKEMCATYLDTPCDKNNQSLLNKVNKENGPTIGVYNYVQKQTSLYTIPIVDNREMDIKVCCIVKNYISLNRICLTFIV